MTEIRQICIVPNYRSVGGPASFIKNFSGELERRGIKVSHELNDASYDAVLVVGGTRNLLGLKRAQQRSIPIIQRLNGINWMHKVQRTGLKHYIKSEYGNRLIAHIRKNFTSKVIYQSEFAKNWWEQKYGLTPVENTVIHNAVNLQDYSPNGEEKPPENVTRVLMVEGRLGGGYEIGLDTGVKLVEELANTHKLPVELVVVGDVDENIKTFWENRSKANIQWMGLVDKNKIPALDRSAHMLFSSDIHPACPNSVIEAMACGLPVLAYDTGSLTELISPQSGRVVPYGGDAWKLDPPDISALAYAAVEIINNQDNLRQGARHRAEESFGLDQMVDNYLRTMGA